MSRVRSRECPSTTSTSSAYGFTESTISPISPSSSLVGMTTVTRGVGHRMRAVGGLADASAGSIATPSRSGQAPCYQCVDRTSRRLLRSCHSSDAHKQIGLAGAILGANLRSPVAAVQGHVRRHLSLQLPLRDVQHLAEEERGRDDARPRSALFFERWPQFAGCI